MGPTGHTSEIGATGKRENVYAFPFTLIFRVSRRLNRMKGVGNETRKWNADEVEDRGCGDVIPDFPFPLPFEFLLGFCLLNPDWLLAMRVFSYSIKSFSAFWNSSLASPTLTICRHHRLKLRTLT